MAPYELVVEDTEAAKVYTYKGDSTLNVNGVGCVQLFDAVAFENPHKIHGSNLVVKSLTMQMGDSVVDGIITFADVNTITSWARVEGLFDLANPNPGEPGSF